MSVVETMIDVLAKHRRNICGQFGEYLKKMEGTLHVTMTSRGGTLKTIEPEDTIQKAKNIFNNLIEPSKRGNAITQQNVDYTLSLSFSEKDHQILEIDKDTTCWTINDKPVKPKAMGQRHYVDSARKEMVAFGIGSAGIDKTYLAMIAAIQASKDGEVNWITFTRPAIEAGEELDFLPGDLQNETGPYLRPLYDALYQIMGAESYLHNSEKGLIEVVPLVYARGRTLNDTYIILDEAQSTMPARMKMFLAHIGFGSGVIVTGDQTQKNLPGGVIPGPNIAVGVLERVDDTGFCYLTSSNVACHPLVQRVVQAHDDYEMKAE